MLSQGPDSVYRSSLLDELQWLTHGFGTRLSDSWPGEYTQVKQIHSDLILHSDVELELVLGQGDAIVTDKPGKLIGIRTADCVPLLLADTRHRAVAAIHAGWKGTVQRIAQKTVERMQVRFGTSPEDLVVAIGPAIGQCCFEVGPEVAEQFEALLPEAVNPRYVNLELANARQVQQAGVPAARIDIAGLCTKCGEHFHSFRRDKDASGRMVAAIGVLE